MGDLNVVVLTGRLTKDPELSYTQNTQTAVCKFTIAVDKRFKKAGSPDADFPLCVAWAKTAEFVERYFSKGMKISIRGRIETRSYDDSNGTRHFVTEVVAEEANFAERKSDNLGDAYEPPAAKTEQPENDYEEPEYDDEINDGLPF